MVILGESSGEKIYMAQLQHNLWVGAARSAVLSAITGGGRWVGIKTRTDPLLSAPHRLAEILAPRRDRLRFSHSLSDPLLAMLINKVGHPDVRLPVSGQP